MATSYVPDPSDASRPTNADMVKMGAAEIRALKEAFTAAWTPKLIATTTYTLVGEDIGQLLVMRNGGTIIIPPEMPFGLFGVSGLQATTVVGSPGSELPQTLIVPPSLLPTLYEDYAFAVVMRMTQNEWLISGNLMFNADVSALTNVRPDSPIAEIQSQLVAVKNSQSLQWDRVIELEDTSVRTSIN